MSVNKFFSGCGGLSDSGEGKGGGGGGGGEQ